MKPALDQMPRILARVRKNGLLLMLDFDGVLAPIVTDPRAARMSRRTRTLLIACARHHQVAVISGRALSDLRSRVGLPGLWYAGNHGAEWRMGKMRGREKHARTVDLELREALRAFIALARRYPRVIVEDKGLTSSVHFRNLSSSRVSQFKKDVQRIAKKFERSLDTEEGNEYVFNIRPRKSRTKGDAVRLARTCAPSRAVAIYIGDDTTDEDGFRALPLGITIRVGKRRGSAARLFVKSRAEVDTFLEALARS